LVAPSDTDREWLGWGPEEGIRVPEAAGCHLCNHTGYAGRTGLYEMVPMDRAVRELVREGAGEDRMASLVFGDSRLATLRDDGAHKVRTGVTTIEEVRRVTFLGDIN
jgi:type II secretory ATPase GspE/PulE/Tfp pilus assembly ATPase PilB-like protein